MSASAGRVGAVQVRHPVTRWIDAGRYACQAVLLRRQTEGPLLYLIKDGKGFAPYFYR